MGTYSYENNPLDGVVIGSRIYASNGAFKDSVVSKPISKMRILHKSQKFMSGESSYIYSEKMNQGAFGISGSYGVSGVSLLKSSLSAYVGHSSAVSSKSITTNYNAVVIGGIEYINFEDLSAGELVSSLNKACKSEVVEVLTAYIAVIDELKKGGRDLLSLLQSNDAKSKPVKELIRTWVARSEKFTNNFGNGLVVGVIWGTMCGVKMEIRSQTNSTAWKYGADGTFEYSNAFASCAVKAAYDGSQAGGSAKVSAVCSRYLSGNALAAQADEWLAKVSDKAFSVLAEIDVIKEAPGLDKIHAAPSVPEFVQPVADSGISEKMDKVGDLKDLDAMAKAAAYDEAKRDNGALTFEEFLKKADEAADKEELDAYRRKMLTNEINTLHFSKKKNVERKAFEKRLKLATGDVISASGSIKPDEGDMTESNTGSAEYAPLGVWITNWSDLFPWLAQARYNSIDDIYGELNVRARVMLQDYQTLSRMYYIAHSCGITEFNRKESQQKTPALNIADSFANATMEMQEMMSDPDENRMKDIYDRLSSAARSIYALWNEVSFLRGCELGLGLVKNSKTIGAAKTNEDKNSNDSRKVYSLTDCDFEGSNFPAFSRAYKVLPLLTPDGDIWAFGPEMGGLSGVYDNEIIFSKPGRSKYFVFEYSKEERTLSNREHGVRLYPIPFSAAKGNSWKGMSFSTNIGSMHGLHETLESLSKRLEKLKAWSFNDANWAKDWDCNKVYKQAEIRKQYLGIIDEIESVI